MVQNAHMADSMNGPITRCPWCSASLPDPSVEQCPSCKATLVGAAGADADIKGVTTLDTEAILRARSAISRPRSGILSFITGDIASDSDGGPAAAESLAPPDAAVRREMYRLQLEAERADLEAETVALKADVLAQRGIHLSQVGDVADVARDANAAGDAGPESVAGIADPDPADAGLAKPAPEAPTADAPDGSWPAELDPTAASPDADPAQPG